MAASFDDRMAAAHAAKREKAYVEQRLADAQDDHDRLTGEVAAARRALAKEQADVDHLGIMFRLLARHRADLDRELAELAAANLHVDELLEELRATEVDLRQLRERAARVADADIAYEVLLAEKELQVRLDPGPLGQQLAAVGERERATRDARRQIAEAIDAGFTAHDALVALRTSVAAIHDDVLRQIATQLGATRHALAGFQRACKDVTATTPCVAVTPIASVAAVVARDLTWQQLAGEAELMAELTAVLALVETAMSALRERDAQLGRGLERLSRERTEALDAPA